MWNAPRPSSVSQRVRKPLWRHCAIVSSILNDLFTPCRWPPDVHGSLRGSSVASDSSSCGEHMPLSKKETREFIATLERMPDERVRDFYLMLGDAIAHGDQIKLPIQSNTGPAQ